MTAGARPPGRPAERDRVRACPSLPGINQGEGGGGGTTECGGARAHTETASQRVLTAGPVQQ